MKTVFNHSCVRWSALSVAVSMLSACAGWLPASGPSVSQISNSSQTLNQTLSNEVVVVDVTEDLLQKLSFYGAGLMRDGIPVSWRSAKPNLVLGQGDSVQVSIFEAPPAVLLSGSSALSNAADLSIGSGAGVMNLPEQMVSQSGTIMVPFAGSVPVAGKTAAQVEQLIRARLSKIANQPQVVARLTQNATNTVVVLADGRSIRMPLTAKGERLLDVLPLSGDAKKVKSTSIRLTRDGITRDVSASILSQHPENNVYLQKGDVVAVLQDPYRVTVLGATNANAAIDFGDEGLTVAEALGRVAGLNDFRADPRGIYIFRKQALTRLGEDNFDEARQPTIFRIDVRDARGMMLAQNFRIRDKDMIYVSNAPSVQWQKVIGIFNNIVGSAASTVNSIDVLK